MIKISTLIESIIELLKTEDGFTDREITDRIKGKSEPQQSINMACRKLAFKGMIVRNMRSDGLLGNFLIAKQSVQQVANFTTIPVQSNSPITNENKSPKIRENEMDQSMRLKFNKEVYIFLNATIKYHQYDIENVYANKNNKTLGETIEHEKYRKFSIMINNTFNEYLNVGLGSFLLELKNNGQIFYQEFLNKHGDKKYCKFSVENNSYLNGKGLYAYCVDGEIKYIGRCRDSYRKRINHGYGKISAKNCYIDGQSTNCHLNSLINTYRDNVKVYLCSMEDDSQISSIEKELIRKIKPPWNIALIN